MCMCVCMYVWNAKWTVTESAIRGNSSIMYVCMYVCVYVCISNAKWTLTERGNSMRLRYYVCVYVCMYVCMECKVDSDRARKQHGTEVLCMYVCMCVYV